MRMSLTNLLSTVGKVDGVELLLNSLPDQLYVKDTACRFVVVNNATAQSLNSRAAEIVGKTDYDFFPPHLADRFFAEEKTLLLSGQPLVSREARSDALDGQLRWVQTTKAVLRDARGEIIGLVGINRDVTARKLVEDQLRLQATALQSIASAVAIADTVGTILWINPAFTKLTGYPQDEAIGRNVRLLKSGAHDKQFYRQIRDTITAGKVWSGEMVNRRRDSQPYIADLSITPVRDTTGEVTRFVFVQRDITERKHAEEQLQQLNADLARSQSELLAAFEDLKQSNAQLIQTQGHLIQAEKLESIGRLAAGIAHEVKNPLAILLMGVSYFEDAASPTNPVTESVLHDMRDAVERADAIVRELLDYASPRQLETTVEDLNAVVQRALRLVHHEFNVSHIAVIREFTDHLPPCTIDRIRIEQVFINLLINACQAMAQGGTLTVRTRTRDHDVVVEVLDTGRGIPAEALPKIFDPFFTTKPVGVGTGMGLAVAKQILLQHAGDLELANRPTGGVHATVTFHNGKEDQDATDRPAGRTNDSH